MADRDGPIAYILTAATAFVQKLLPNWTPPDLKHPYATVCDYDNPLDMLADIKPGAQIMVRDASGYSHHGIYVGRQSLEPGRRATFAVVDVWGPDKQRATVSLRPYHDFVANGTCFAEACYPDGTALDQALSADIALAMAHHAKSTAFVYDAAFNNCEHFATMCRCLRCATHLREYHKYIDNAFGHIPDAPLHLAPRGFVGI